MYKYIVIRINIIRYPVDFQHPAMRCLDDVMRYFIETAGHDTKPLITNDLERFGVQLDPYSFRIPEHGKYYTVFKCKVTF